MPEIILVFVVAGILLSPQLIAGFLAKSMGRSFWFWFGISFILPFIAIFILVYLKDHRPGDKGYKLAAHVKQRKQAI